MSISFRYLVIIFVAITLFVFFFIFSSSSNLFFHQITSQHDKDEDSPFEKFPATTTTITPSSTKKIKISPQLDNGNSAVAKPSTSKFSSPSILIDNIPPQKSFIEKLLLPPKSSEGTTSKFEKQIQNGMQPKFLVQNIGFKKNQFYWMADTKNNKQQKNSAAFPLDKIYLPDGQVGPMKQNHKYTGHKIITVSSSSLKCKFRVARPTVFLYRMSGHSTYHLWENNLGPFFQTLLDFRRDFVEGDALFDPSELLIVFTDNKPRSGPKNPLLLDQLLRTFTDLPLINASRIGEDDSIFAKDEVICFDRAILGISSSSYRMRPLVELMKKNVLVERKSDLKSVEETESDQTQKPDVKNLRAVYISRNHPSIIRGRKIRNEDAFLDALNETLIKNGITKGVELVFMEQMTYTQQVEFATHVDIMFSPHGGGVANCIWMKPKSVMVEFVAPIGKTLPGMYHSMCSRSGIQHFSFLADPDPDDEKNTDPVYLSNPRLFSNMVVPVEKIRENAEKAVKLWKSKNGL